MKLARLKCIAATALLTALAIPLGLAAQQRAKTPLYYQFVELPTLGGPNSAFTGQAYVLNNRGIAVGTADTSTPDPNYPNFNPLLGKNPFIQHAFRWNKGHMKDMGALPGTNSSFVNSENENDEAVGMSENGSIDPVTGWPEVTAVLWEPGHKTPTALGTLTGGYESFAILINNSGLVAGVSDNAVSDPYSLFGFPTQTRTFVWTSGGGMQDIGTLGGPDAAPNSSTINQLGQIAGLSYTNDKPNSVATPCGTNIPTQDPFFWDATGMTDVGTLGGTCGFAIAMNNHGQVVGQSDLKGDAVHHPFFWQKGMKKPLDLGTFGGNNGIAGWINDGGEVVGLANTKIGEDRAFLWKKGEKKRNLGILKGDHCNAAWVINSKTQIIGDTSTTCQWTTQRPFLWQNGSMYDLSVLFPSSRFRSSEAVFINDLGEIAGDGTLQNGETRPFLLIPCKAGTKGCKRLIAGTSAARRTSSPSRDASSRMQSPFPMQNVYRYRLVARATPPKE